MNIRSSRPALFAPALIVLLAGALSIPRSRADCCAGRDGGGAFGGSSGSTHGSLQGVFGGSSTRPILLQNNSSSDSVIVKYGPRSVGLEGGQSKRRDFGGSDPSSGSVGPLPGEGVAATLSGSSGNSGTTPTVSLTEESQCPPKVAYDNTGTTGWEPLERRITLAIPAVNATTTGPLVRIPVSGRGEGNADVPSLVDLNDFGYGGAVVTPGAVSLDASGKIVVSNTGVMVAASLGPGTDGGSGRLGYIIPTTGTGGVYKFAKTQSILVATTSL